MHFVTAALAAMAALATAGPLSEPRATSPLQVTLAMVDNTKVKASIKNTGTQSYNIMHRGTLLDSYPVNSLTVLSSSGPATFEGIQFTVAMSNFTEDSFTPISAGQTVEKEIEMASIYNITSGAYTVSTSGLLQYANAGSTLLTNNVLHFSSNTLKFNVDAAKAATVAKKYPAPAQLQDRTAVYQPSCRGNYLAIVTTALGGCDQVARAGSEEAANGDAQKFFQYFKTTSAAARSSVSRRLAAIATDCSNYISGKSVTYCAADPLGQLNCPANVLAYAYPAYNYIIYCPVFFSAGYPYTTNQCHGNDKITTEKRLLYKGALPS